MARVFLIGFMGSGKTFLSKRLAQAMNFNLIDLDKYIEEKYFSTVPQLFEKYGEAGFRERERVALAEVSQIENVIVATGGGAPCFFDNMQRMNNAGLTLYIKVPETVIVDRLIHSKHKRPLVDGKSKQELEEFVSAKIVEREEFYLQAKAIINPIEQSIDEIVSLIENNI
jgi:shikimate kinase